MKRFSNYMMVGEKDITIVIYFNILLYIYYYYIAFMVSQIIVEKTYWMLHSLVILIQALYLQTIHKSHCCCKNLSV